jgi:hypothetical protein
MASFMQASAERGLPFFTGNFCSSCLLEPLLSVASCRQPISGLQFNRDKN